MMDKDQFLLLVTKALSGNASPEEERLLLDTLAAHSDWQSLYDLYKRYWESKPLNRPAEVEKALSATRQKIQALEEHATMEDVAAKGISAAAPLVIGDNPSVEALSPVALASEEVIPMQSNRRWRVWAVAAVMLGIICTGAWFFFLRHSTTATEWVDTYNPKGIRSTIVLPDGSKVWLAADSRLKYPRHFATDKRDLFLEGEAFFEVTRNPQKPFEVHLEEGSVRVLGTSFDIKAYKEQTDVVTSLATGKVTFTPRKGGEEGVIFLTPGHKSIYNIEGGTTQVKETDAQADRAWTEGVLQFDAETLGSIALSLERYYGKTVIFRDEQLKLLRYTGKFANSSAAEVLQYLSKTKAFVYTLSDSLIVIGK